MGKVKSAIITSLLVIAIIVAAFFATVSYSIGKTERYNSIASSIHLGAEFTGSAYAILYPEGVISAQDYKYKTEEEAEEYVAVGGVYVEKDKVADGGLQTLKDAVAADASVLNDRFGEKGYSSYSVSIEDGVTVKVSVPTGYSYASYRGYNTSTASTDFSAASASLSALTVDGIFTLRTTDSSVSNRKDDYTSTTSVSGTKTETYPVTKVTEDASSFFKSASTYTIGTTSVLSLDLTETGQERIRTITNSLLDSSDATLYFFVGDTQLIALSVTSTINIAKIELQMTDQATAENVAIALDSAIKGKILTENYELGEVLTSVAAAGDNAAVFAGVASLVGLAAVIVFFLVRYKKLGIVTMLVSLAFALVIVYAAFLLEIQLSFAAIITAFVGLFLLCASNYIVFEEIRKQTKTGKTMQSSIKTAYKRTLLPIAEMHIVAVVAAVIALFVAVGEVAACGYVLFIATLASYVLYWFTRFMWYVISSPVRDKFSFGGYKREVYGDE